MERSSWPTHYFHVCGQSRRRLCCRCCGCGWWSICKMFMMRIALLVAVAVAVVASLVSGVWLSMSPRYSTHTFHHTYEHAMPIVCGRSRCRPANHLSRIACRPPVRVRPPRRQTAFRALPHIDKWRCIASALVRSCGDLLSCGRIVSRTASCLS